RGREVLLDQHRVRQVLKYRIADAMQLSAPYSERIGLGDVDRLGLRHRVRRLREIGGALLISPNVPLVNREPDAADEEARKQRDDQAELGGHSWPCQ